MRLNFDKTKYNAFVTVGLLGSLCHVYGLVSAICCRLHEFVYFKASSSIDTTKVGSCQLEKVKVQKKLVGLVRVKAVQ